MGVPERFFFGYVEEAIFSQNIMGDDHEYKKIAKDNRSKDGKEAATTIAICLVIALLIWRCTRAHEIERNFKLAYQKENNDSLHKILVKSNAGKSSGIEPIRAINEAENFRKTGDFESAVRSL